MKGALNELALFAGAGGGILGSILLGHRIICAVECEPYCQAVLIQRQKDGILPPFPIWDDVRTFDGTRWRGKVDIVSGGFPCQDISPAGGGKGLDGEKSGLWFEMRRIIGEIEPPIVFIENSAMLVSRGLQRVLDDLASLGFDATWGVFSACSVGAPHTRERLFIMAHSNEVGWKERVGIGERKKQEVGPCSIWGSCKQEREDGYFKVRMETEPAGIGLDDGFSDRVDQLYASGNAQVPRVVVEAWNTLMERIEDKP